MEVSAIIREIARLQTLNDAQLSRPGHLAQKPNSH
jgi:hypothetical protein